MGEMSDPIEESFGAEEAGNTGEATDTQDVIHTDEEQTGDSASRKVIKAPTRQYIRDRCDGISKYGDSRPPLRPCLPPPCVKWCPSVLEQNCLCEWAGSLGLIKPDNDKWRRRIFWVALVSNIVGFALTIVACFSISLHYDTLMKTAFSSGYTVSDNPDFPGVKIGIGLRGIAIHRPFKTPSNVVWKFDEACNRSINTGSIDYFGDGVCSGCADHSAGLVSTLIVSLITYFPNIFTDVLRMYSNYDVNCQKMFGSFITLASLLLSLYTWRVYVQSCFAVFYDGIIPYDDNGSAFTPEEINAMSDEEKRLNILVRMDYHWKAGPGLICVITATCLKIVDILCNMM